MTRSAQLLQCKDRHDQQQRRRIETWRGTRELDRFDCVTEDRRYRVAERIHDADDDGAEIEERTAVHSNTHATPSLKAAAWSVGDLVSTGC